MTINYKVVGDGIPVIILHGWSLDHQAMFSCLEPVFQKKRGYKRFYIDFPGMGGSQALESIHNSDDMLKAILELIDLIIPDESFLLCGYSYGGYIARGIVHSRKSLVRGMMLIAPVIKAEYDQRILPHHQILMEDPTLISQLSSQEAAEFEPMAVVQGEQEWKRFQKEILLPSKKANAEWMNHIQQNGYGYTFNLDEGSQSFEFPALIITGRQDSVAGYEDAWEFIDRYPRATFAVLDMAGHNLQIEQPDLFEALVGNWLERA